MDFDIFDLRAHIAMQGRFVEVHRWMRHRFAIVIPSRVFANENLMVGRTGRRQPLLACPRLECHTGNGRRSCGAKDGASPGETTSMEQGAYPGGRSMSAAKLA
jgi:hypothetical protein